MSTTTNPDPEQDPEPEPERIILSREDQIRFVEILLASPGSRERLARARAAYRRLIRTTPPDRPE